MVYAILFFSSIIISYSVGFYVACKFLEDHFKPKPKPKSKVQRRRMI